MKSFGHFSDFAFVIRMHMFTTTQVIFEKGVYISILFAILSENIALQKPTYQKHQYLRLADSLTRASNAVDGLKTNLSVLGAQCVISENDQPSALLWVNLTSILSIHHINIYFRTENNPWSKWLKMLQCYT